MTSPQYNAVASWASTQICRRPSLILIFGDVNIYGNNADSYYHSAQLKWEKRFSRGLSYMLSYAFSKHIDDKVSPTPFAPEGYDRGRSEF